MAEVNPPVVDKEEKKEIVQVQPQDLKACVLGGTGATGKALVKELVEDRAHFSRVTAIVRRVIDKPEEYWHLKAEDIKDRFEQKQVDFDNLKDHAKDFEGFDVGFCCLGTTKSKAGSAEAFRKVDFDYVVESARLLKAGGTKHYNLMTSQGSNPDSWFLYPQTKGQAEEECKKMGFPRLSIYRPGLLLTEREESRPLEYVFQAIYPNFLLPQVAKATSVEAVARSMRLASIREPLSEVEVYGNAEVRQFQVGKDWEKLNEEKQ